jgi:negative regulator of replication initiation
MTTIRISDEVEEYIKRRGNFGETHDDVLRRYLVDFDQMNESFKKKQELLEMARRGEGKPDKGKNPLAKSLDRYLSRSSSYYDCAFEEQIRKLQPAWFE